MKNILRTILLSALVLSGYDTFAQQDPLYSQYMFNPLSVNPAYAGSRGVMNGALVYRKQWVDFPGAPSTAVFAINTPMRKGKVGLGFEVVSDKIGPKTSTGAYLAYAYRLRMGKGKFAFGLSAGALNYTMNWGAIGYRDQGDAYAQLSRESKMLIDIKGGIYFNNKKFYIGASMTHLNNAQYGHFIADSIVNTAQLTTHGFFNFGWAFSMGPNFTFSPSVMFRHVFNVPLATSADLNLNFRYKEVMWFGISLRSEKSLVVLAQYNINDKIKVGYSYDAAMGRMKGYHANSHEIMLGFDLDIFRSQIQSPRFF